MPKLALIKKAPIVPAGPVLGSLAAVSWAAGWIVVVAVGAGCAGCWGVTVGWLLVVWVLVFVLLLVTLTSWDCDCDWDWLWVCVTFG